MACSPALPCHPECLDGLFAEDSLNGWSFSLWKKTIPASFASMVSHQHMVYIYTHYIYILYIYIHYKYILYIYTIYIYYIYTILYIYTIYILYIYYIYTIYILYIYYIYTIYILYIYYIYTIYIHYIYPHCIHIELMNLSHHCIPLHSQKHPATSMDTWRRPARNRFIWATSKTRLPYAKHIPNRRSIQKME